mgnify:CR=1 FL=1
MFYTPGQMIALIYGRRIGKRELIKQVLKETEIKSIYYECKQTSEQNNVDSLSELVGEIFDFPKPTFEDMESLLKFLFKASEKESLIFVLDEYPYLRENVKEIDSVLQSVIDEYRDTSNIKVIICGSYVDTMKELLARHNPLYGRIDEKKSVKENIIDLISSSGARLENEVSMYLNSEISKITNANEVFEALARGF